MKKIFSLLLLFQFVHLSYGQTLEEWTRQKKTQRKYLLQQIAALQVYLGYAKKGYDIASKGLNTIRNIKTGDFNLHRDFFGSLRQVNPKIRTSVKVADIIAYQVRIIKKTKQNLQVIRETVQFTTDELDYCKIVFDNLLEECMKTIDELFLVISRGELEMKDDERIKRVDKLYLDMQNKYAFNSSFSNEVRLLSAQRMGEQLELNHSKILNGLQ